MVKRICIYCGSSRNVEDEHVRATSKGGARTVPTCRFCSKSKGDKALKEWLRRVKKDDKYRWDRIAIHNHGRRNDIAKRVHEVRDE